MALLGPRWGTCGLLCTLELGLGSGTTFRIVFGSLQFSPSKEEKSFYLYFRSCASFLPGCYDASPVHVFILFPQQLFTEGLCYARETLRLT